MIMIVDYGLGNIRAIRNIYEQLGIEVEIARSADQLERADKIILPGVGAFDWAMECLGASGMVDRLSQLVAVEKRLVLGICVGMQMMARRSDEGHLDGLGWIDAEVKRFGDTDSERPMQLPHMGWNVVLPHRTDGLFRDLHAPLYYFLHSYYFNPSNDVHVLATSDYHGHFPSAVHSDNILGVQFHPEKSHGWGIRLLKNFAEM